MNKVIIDNKGRLVFIDGKKIPRFLLGIMQGAIGKCFVVKHYRGKRRKKIVVTRFPDMSGIEPTKKQKVRRDLFREAVVWAKWIIADEERKLAFKRTLPRKKRQRVYQAALQMYIREKGNQQWMSKQLAVMAVVESRRREILNGNSVYEQQRQWRVMWQKRKGMVDGSEQVVKDGSLVVLQT